MADLIEDRGNVRYTVSCDDCGIDTYGYGDDYPTIAREHVAEYPSHTVHMSETVWVTLTGVALEGTDR